MNDNTREGSYTAPKEQYWKRHNRIASKIANAFRGKNQYGMWEIEEKIITPIKNSKIKIQCA